MLTTRWYRLFAVATLAVPVLARAQGPQPVIKEIATIPGVAAEFPILMPNGHVILFGEHDSVCTYDTRTKVIRKIVSDWQDELVLSPNGDRIAFGHTGEKGQQYIWTMPINPTTGAPAGAPQRVSISAGDAPSFSPDGRSIAFDAWLPKGPGGDLTTVPATGGAERTIARLRNGTNQTQWSADGRWLFSIAREDSVGTLSRTAVAGGPTTAVVSFTSRFYPEGAVDGKIAFYQADNAAASEGRLAYVTEAGAHGEVQLAPGATTNLSLRSHQPLFASVHRAGSLQLANIAAGTVRTVTAPSIVPGSIRWSLDGRRFAALLADARLEPHGGVIVMNADGSGQRQYNVPATGGLQLSPHGDMLALGTPHEGQIRLLDLANGQVRTMNPPIKSAIGMHWRSDGKAILVESLLTVAGSDKPHLAIVSVDLTGNSTILRDVTAEFPDAIRADPFSDNYAVVSGTTRQPRFVVIPIGGGPARPGDTPPLNGGTAFRPFDSSGWLLEQIKSSSGTFSVRLYDTTARLVREVQLPFKKVVRAHAFPDGSGALVVAQGASDIAPRYYNVQFDGRTPRMIAGEGGVSMTESLSPDGKTLAFVPAVLQGTKIDAVDFTPVLRALGIH